MNGLKAWKRIFYPISAEAVVYSGDSLDIIEHSIRKWIGLDHTDEFGLQKIGAHLEDINDSLALSISDTTCSLCVAYRKLEKGCKTCPYVKVHGVQCFAGGSSPYAIYCATGDPKPMIQALVQLLPK